MAGSIWVRVVSATGVVWRADDATSVIVRTTEGDIGFLAGHEPVLAVLVPCAAQIETPRGREVVFVDNGYVAVAEDRVAVLSQYGQMAGDIDADAAARELEEASARSAEADDPEARARLRLAQARMAAVDLVSGKPRAE